MTRSERPAFRLRGYEVERLLGRGASGEVWRARATASGHAVALKRLSLEPGSDVEAQARRARAEAAVLTVLDHPNLVRLHDVVRADDAVVLVLDLADGGSLADLLRARGRLSPGEVITAIAPVAAALAYVHRQGVVHGDISPANVLFTPGGVALLADLGTARLLGDDIDAESTPAYVDPAVALGGVPAPPSDVFMLGAVALHALTGRPPWTGRDAEAALAAARLGRLEGVADAIVAAGAPPDMAAVVAGALAVQPWRRCSAADLALDLRHSGTPVAVELSAGRPRQHVAQPPVPEPRAPVRDAPSAGNDAHVRAVADEDDRLADPFATPRRAPFAGVGHPATADDRRGECGAPGAADRAADRVEVARAGRAAVAGARRGSGRRADRREVYGPRHAALPNAYGARPGADGMPPTRYGVASGADGVASGADGVAPTAYGVPPTRAVCPRPRPQLPHVPDRGANLWSPVAAALRRSRRPLAVGSALLVAAACGAAIAVGVTEPFDAAAEPGARSAPVASAPHTTTSREATRPGPATSRPAPAGSRTAAPSPSASPSSRTVPGPQGPVPAQGSWWQALRTLDATRARAYATRDLALLADVYGSPRLLATDAATLRRTVPAGCGLEGAVTRYNRVRVRVVTSARAAVTARAAIPSTRLRCGTAGDRVVAPVPPTTVRLELARGARGVRIVAQTVGGTT
ncbi:protein kinase domain-containing protein [Jatrophihabitans fulvus]